MLRLLGFNRVLGVLLGGALLAVGLLTQRPVLAVAGGFVGVVYAFRLLSGSTAGRDNEGGSRRGPRSRL
jgi:succinate-acetate transporter protein